MKITRCKQGHYYDKAYFRQCPHCHKGEANEYWAADGWDEDIQTESNVLSVPMDKIQSSAERKQERSGQINHQETRDNKAGREVKADRDDKAESKYREDRNNKAENKYGEDRDNKAGRAYREDRDDKVEREYRADRDSKTERELKAEKRYKEESGDKEKRKKTERQEDRQCRSECWTEEEKAGTEVQKTKKKEIAENNKQKSNLMIMASMPAKPMKNQEFCVDFCVISQSEWKNGADMLVFKNRDGSRDIKLVALNLPSYGMIEIRYKDELLFASEEILLSGDEIQLLTFPVTVTDNRDRRFHKIQVEFVAEEDNLRVPLYLIPQG